MPEPEEMKQMRRDQKTGRSAYAENRPTQAATLRDDMTLTVWYDARCPWCRRAADWMRARDSRGILDCRPLQEMDKRAGAACGIDPVEALREIYVVSAAGEIRRGADGVLWVLEHLPGFRLVAAFARIPGVRPLLARGYRWVAARRPRD